MPVRAVDKKKRNFSFVLPETLEATSVVTTRSATLILDPDPRTNIARRWHGFFRWLNSSARLLNRHCRQFTRSVEKKLIHVPVFQFLHTQFMLVYNFQENETFKKLIKHDWTKFKERLNLRKIPPFHWKRLGPRRHISSEPWMQLPRNFDRTLHEYNNLNFRNDPKLSTPLNL